MALFGETANLAVELNLKGNFTQEVNKAKTSLGGLNKQTAANTAGIGKMSKGVGGFTSKIKGLAGPAKSSILTGFGMGGGLLAFGALTSAVGAAVNVIGDAVRAAGEEESAIEQLTVAIEANDRAWDGNIDAVEELISKRQDLAFADSEQRESLQLLVGYTKDLTRAQDVLAVSMDFARFRNIDLRTASDLLGKAMSGNTSLLSRYGIMVRKGATATEVLEQVQRLAKGQAEAYANTTAGKLTRAQIAYGDAMEELGKVLTPVVGDLALMASKVIPQLVTEVKDAVAQFEPFIDAFQGIKGGIDDVINAIPPEARNFWDDFTGGLGPVPNALGKVAAAADEVIGTGERLPGIFGDIQGGLQDLQRATIGVNEDNDSLNRSYDLTLPIFTNVAKAADNLAQSYDPLSSITTATAQRMQALADATKDAWRELDSFRDAADRIAETDSLKEINKEIEKQKKLRRQAARAGDVAGFAAAQAALDQARGQRELRKQGRQSLKAFLANTGKQKSAQKDVTQKVNATSKALDDLGKKRPSIKVDTAQLQAAINKARTLGALLNTVGGAIVGGVTGNEEHRAQGGPVQAFKTYQVNENGTEYFTPQSNGYIHDARTTAAMMGGGPVAVSVVTNVDISAATAHDNIDKVVRTNRSRANVA